MVPSSGASAAAVSKFGNAAEKIKLIDNLFYKQIGGFDTAHPTHLFFNKSKSHNFGWISDVFAIIPAPLMPGVPTKPKHASNTA